MPFEVSPHLQAGLYAVAVLATAIVVGLVGGRLVLFGLGRALRREGGQQDLLTSARLRRPMMLFMPTAAVLLALPAMDLPMEAQILVRRLAALALIAATGWISTGLIHLVSDLTIRRYSIDRPDNLVQREVQTRVAVFRRTGVVVIVAITAAIMMMTIPSIRHLGVSLFASAGVAGLVVGLAARSTISNLIAGLQIALTQPIRVDDVVIVEGEWGWIEEITTTYVVVRIWDLRRLIVPLTHFIEKPFQNWTRQTANILGSVFLQVDYTVPVDEVRSELQRIVGQSDLWDGEVCGLQVTDATDRAVTLRALVGARDSSDAWDLRCLVREKLIAFVQARYPQALPRLRAELERNGERQAA